MSHRNLLVFDIETIPDTDVVPNLTGYDGADVAERRAELTRYHLQVTDGRNAFPRQPFHRIVAVSFLLAEIERDGAQEIYYLKELRSGGTLESTEAQMVAGFFQFLGRHRPRLVSFNGRGFDLPVLKYRAMIHGIAAPYFHQSGDKWNSYQSRYAQDWHCDLMEALSDYGASARVKLSEVCAALGLPGKFDMDGAKVAESFDQGGIAEIRDYCESDVLNSYLIYLRHRLHQGLLSEDAHERALADLASYLEAEGAERPHLAQFLIAWGEASATRTSGKKGA